MREVRKRERKYRMMEGEIGCKKLERERERGEEKKKGRGVDKDVEGKEN